MPPPTRLLERAAFLLTCGSVVANPFSIAVSHGLLGLALAALLLSGTPLRLPPVRIPLALFILGTVISLALSEDPAAGRPQIRKFYVYLILLAVFSVVRGMNRVRPLLVATAGAAALSAVHSLFQFQQKLERARELGRNFSEYYTPERITGFMSHWMTFGGQMMILLLVLAAFLMFSPGRAKGLWFWLLAAVLLGAALVLNMTRGIWLGAFAGGVYLVFRWKPRLVLAVPVLLAAGYFVAPASLRERANSIFRPRGDLDSNQFRIITWRTGLEIVKAHPWFGIGPEHVKLHFNDYVPEDVPRPLPQGWYGHLHNIYLHYAAERGIPAMLALLWMLGKILCDFLRALRGMPAGPDDAKFALHAGVAVLIATLVTGMFELNLGDSEVLLLFLAVTGCGYAAAEQAARTGGATTPELSR